MTATKTREYAKSAERTPKAEKPNFCSTIASEVLTLLGTPGDLARVKAINLFDNAYRVNVYRTTGDSMIKSSTISDSFFVVADDHGHIVKSNITKKYPLEKDV